MASISQNNVAEANVKEVMHSKNLYPKVSLSIANLSLFTAFDLTKFTVSCRFWLS